MILADDLPQFVVGAGETLERLKAVTDPDMPRLLDGDRLISFAFYGVRLPVSRDGLEIIHGNKRISLLPDKEIAEEDFPSDGLVRGELNAAVLTSEEDEEVEDSLLGSMDADGDVDPGTPDGLSGWAE